MNNSSLELQDSSSDSVIGNTTTAIINGDVDTIQTTALQGGSMNIVIRILFIVVITAGIIETGTFFGIILPSDIILSAALITLILLKQWLMVFVMIAVSIVFTIIGDQFGYYLGYKLGNNLYDREDKRYFKKKYLIQAQESLNRGGERFLYKGRFVGFGGLLPIIYGMMKRDRTRFFKVSVGSALVWKLSVTLPLVLVLLLFPNLQTKFILLMTLVAAVPEIIGWIWLLFPEFKKYSERLSGAKTQISELRKSLGGLVETLNTPTDEQLQRQQDRETEQAKKQQEMFEKDAERQRRIEAGNLTLGEKIVHKSELLGGSALDLSKKVGTAIGSQVVLLKEKIIQPDEEHSSNTHVQYQESDDYADHMTGQADLVDTAPSSDQTTPGLASKIKSLGQQLGQSTKTMTNKVSHTVSSQVSVIKNKFIPGSSDHPDTD